MSRTPVCKTNSFFRERVTPNFAMNNKKGLLQGKCFAAVLILCSGKIFTKPSYFNHEDIIMTGYDIGTVKETQTKAFNQGGITL